MATRRGNPIPNVIEGDPTTRTRTVRAAIRKKHPNWRERTPDTGVYNCAGMVWASRRTSILTDFHDILRDDAYRALRSDETPRVGDLAIYADGKNHAHVGVIVSVTPGLVIGSTPLPELLSKWDSVSGEFVHLVNDHPFQDVKYEYWTDRA